jgi:ABC-type nitrate/sulfonate/bicarbonate transport system substrate-binding protein
LISKGISSTYSIVGIVIALLIGVAGTYVYFQSNPVTIPGQVSTITQTKTNTITNTQTQTVTTTVEPTPEIKQVKISWFAPASMQIPLIASEMNFDEEFGIDLELIRMTRAPDAIQALLTGDLDITFGAFTPVESAILQGADLKGIMNAYYGGYKFALVTLNTTGITTVEDLAGATIAVPGLGAPPELFVRKALEIAGLASDSYNLIQMALDGIPAALITGEVGAGMLFEPPLTGFMAKQPGVIVLARGVDIPVVNYSPGSYFVRNEDVKQDNELYYKVFLTLAKAQWYIRTAGADSDEILSILSNATNVPIPVLKPSANKNIWDPRMKPVIEVNLLEEMNFFIDIGKIDSTIPVSDMWYNSYYERALIEHPELFSDLDDYISDLQQNGVAFDVDFITDLNEYLAIQ